MIINSLPYLLAVAITALVYALMLYVHRRFCPYPWAHPLVLSVLCLSVGLFSLNIPVQDYQGYTQIIHWFLGPVTVALAIPIYQQWPNIKQLGWKLLLAIAVGGVVAPLLAWSSLWAAQAPEAIQLTFLVKSITTPLAMGAADNIGGVPALAAVVVIVTGIVGACAADWVFRVIKIDDKQAQGLALGTVAHAVGTAKAVAESAHTGAFASVALCINGIATALILPWVFWLFNS